MVVHVGAYISIILFLFTCIVHKVNPAAFGGQDVTYNLFGSNNQDIYPTAFGDFNQDKLTDVFTVNGSAVQIYFAQEEAPLLKLMIHVEIKSRDGNSVVITGLTPADYNGDGLMDLMVTYLPNSSELKDNYNIVEVRLCQGNMKALDCELGGNDKNPIRMIQEPLVADINADFIMDLVGEVWVKQENKNDGMKIKKAWLCNEQNNSEKLTLDIRCNPYTFSIDDTEFYKSFPNDIPNYYPNSKLSQIQPSSNAFVDSDGDTIPELIIVTESKNADNGSKFIEYYEVGNYVNKTHWSFKLVKVIPLPPNISVGQPIFMDINQDGKLYHILPYISNNSTGLKLINSRDRQVNDLMILPDEDHNDLNSWRFVQNAGNNDSNSNNALLLYSKSIVLRVGDYNLDGYVDMLAIMRNIKNPNDVRAVIFENVMCISKSNRKESCVVPRTFQLNFRSLSNYKTASLATFYDIFEDGLLDVLIVGYNNKSGHYGISGILNNQAYDANFLKVVVTTGRKCFPIACPQGGIPYGNILPGPVIKYVMTTQDGREQKAVGAQMYRSSYVPLDLPYVFFGLGHSRNFIETLDVSLSLRENRKAHKTWTQLIPNSQVIILPYPEKGSEENKLYKNWKAKIFLPSSKAALHTFGVLLCFCLAIVFIILLFHWKERKEDRHEKSYESHPFHML